MCYAVVRSRFDAGFCGRTGSVVSPLLGAAIKPGIDPGRRNMSKRLIATPLLAVLLLLLATTAPVAADGALFIGVELMWQDLSQLAQRAVILYDRSTGNGTQHLILSVSFEGDAEEFAWVVPVPGKPEITLSDAKLFEELSDLTIRAVPEPGWPGFGCAAGDIGPPANGVDVIDEKVVGPYATAVLAATNPTALVDWLNQNGYLFPEEAREIIGEYIEKEWYFVATRINALDEETGHALAEGAIEPIVLSFASDEIVYPLRITSLSATSPDVLLYVLADRVVVPKQYPLRVGYGYWRDNAFSLEYGDMVSVDELSGYDILPGLVSTYLAGADFYLTKLRGRITADQMVDIELIGHESGGEAYLFGYSWSRGSVVSGANLNSGDVIPFIMLFAPAFSLYLWRRHRRGVSKAGR
jgi:hypothetical protein